MTEARLVRVKSHATPVVAKVDCQNDQKRYTLLTSVAGPTFLHETLVVFDRFHVMFAPELSVLHGIQHLLRVLPRG